MTRTRTCTAFHEAGHAVALHANGLKVTSVSIARTSQGEYDSNGHCAFLSDPAVPIWAYMVTFAAGRAANELQNGTADIDHACTGDDRTIAAFAERLPVQGLTRADAIRMVRDEASALLIEMWSDVQALAYLQALDRFFVFGLVTSIEDRDLRVVSAFLSVKLLKNTILADKDRAFGRRQFHLLLYSPSNQHRRPGRGVKAHAD